LFITKILYFNFMSIFSFISFLIRYKKIKLFFSSKLKLY
jgi:hypothetical protein